MWTPTERHFVNGGPTLELFHWGDHSINGFFLAEISITGITRAKIVYSQWIGWWENLEETMVFTMKYRAFLFYFPLNQSNDIAFNTEMLYDLEGMGVTLFYDTSIVAESVGIGHWCQEDYFAKAAILLCIPENKWFVIYNSSADLPSGEHT